MTKTATRRDHLIETSLKLFSKHGYHATGIDTILKEAKVSKKTLYRYFRSKDELIVAVLKYYDTLFRTSFVKNVEARADSPKAKLLAIFDVAMSWFKHRAFYGCLFINATSEFADGPSEIRSACKEFKRLIHGYILSLCVEAGVTKPLETADKIALLLEGAIVTAQVSQNPRAAITAKSIVEELLSV